MTRTIELTAEWESPWPVHVYFTRNTVEININGRTLQIDLDDFDKIAAELANFRKLNDSVKDQAA